MLGVEFICFGEDFIDGIVDILVLSLDGVCSNLVLFFIIFNVYFVYIVELSEDVGLLFCIF